MDGARGPRDSQPADEPGWWQASDLKWYPPEATPGWAAKPAPPDPAAQPMWVDVGHTPATSTPWWKRRWVQVAAAVFAVLLIIGAVSGNKSSKRTAKVVAPKTTVVS